MDINVICVVGRRVVGIAVVGGSIRKKKKKKETRVSKMSSFKGSQLAKWKSTFLTCHCHKIYGVESVGQYKHT